MLLGAMAKYLPGMVCIERFLTPGIIIGKVLMIRKFGMQFTWYLCAEDFWLAQSVLGSGGWVVDTVPC